MTEQFLGFTRDYPRPRINCTECNNELVLKWGNKKIPHFSHFNKGKIKCNFNKETLQHKLSKELICELLNNKCIIKINIPCDNCFDNEVVDITLQDNENAYNEYKFENEIYDVAIVKNNQIIKVIEIYHTHYTHKRLINEWYELSTDNILNNIGKNKLQDIKELKLNCIRKRNKCNKTNCFNMFQIAKQLQYGAHYFSNTETYEIKKAMTKREQPFFWFSIEPFWKENNEKPPDNNFIWNIFLKRQQCLSCKTPENTKKFKPYCIKCWKLIIKGFDSFYGLPNETKLFDTEKIKYTNYPLIKNDNEITRLRNKYSFLNNIDNWTNIQINSKCSKCKTNLLDDNNYIKYELIWWMGCNKKICHNCLK